MNFKLSDNQKYNMIWTLLNSRFNEENDYTMDYAICDVYDEECVQILEEYDGDEEALEWEENHRFIIPDGAHWDDVRQASENVGLAIVEAFYRIEAHNRDKLHGIFGDAAWTNKKRLPDSLLKDLLEHFSSKTLSLANCPEDELGQGYEYLIKKFADDSGHTAQEFYTNRTVVHLMTEMLKPRSGESVYDPTCGSAGMLISCIAYLKARGLEWRNVSLYGQEINQLSSAISRMNLFLHGAKEFKIVREDTLRNPAFIHRLRLLSFCHLQRIYFTVADIVKSILLLVIAGSQLVAPGSEFRHRFFLLGCQIHAAQLESAAAHIPVLAADNQRSLRSPEDAAHRRIFRYQD